jgi:hypothetical protein
MRKVMLFLIAVALVGCGARPMVSPPVSALDTGLTKRCEDKPTIPPDAAKNGLSEGAAVRIIGRYEVIYDDCASRHARTVEIIEGRDAALSARP